MLYVIVELTHSPVSPVKNKYFLRNVSFAALDNMSQ